MTFTLSRTVLLGVILLLLAWAGSAAIAYGLGSRAEAKISNEATCERAAWAKYQQAVQAYNSGPQTATERATFNAAYDLYENEFGDCLDHFRQ